MVPDKAPPGRLVHCIWVAPCEIEAGVHTRKPDLLTLTHHFLPLTLCCLPGEFLRTWEKEEWNEKSEYKQ